VADQWQAILRVDKMSLSHEDVSLTQSDEDVMDNPLTVYFF